eukprot:jgi/Tetstr1/444196/TSEL_032090.t1
MPPDSRLGRRRSRSAIGISERRGTVSSPFGVAPVGARPNRFATAGDDGVIILWDANVACEGPETEPVAQDVNGESLEATQNGLIGRLVGHEGPVLSVAYCAAEGPLRLVSGGADKKVRLWQPELLESGSSSEECCQAVLSGHADAVNAVHYSPDGNMVASGSEDTTIRVWDAHHGKTVRKLDHHTEAVRTVAWRPHGHRLASGGDDRTVRIFNLDEEEEEKVQMCNLRGHRSPVLCVSWRRDGWRLASGSADREIRVWDPYQKVVVVKLAEHASHVTALAWPPHGRYLASGSSDRSVRNWDADPKAFAVELMNLTGHTDDVNGLAWSADAKILVTVGDSTIRLWKPYPKRAALAVLTGHDGVVRAVSWVPPVPREAPERPESA